MKNMRDLVVILFLRCDLILFSRFIIITKLIKIVLFHFSDTKVWERVIIVNIILIPIKWILLLRK